MRTAIPAIQQAVSESKTKGGQETRGSPNAVLYNKRDGEAGWGKYYSNTQFAVNDAVKSIDENLYNAFVDEIENSTEKGIAHTPITNAFIAVQEDVRQDTITPIQGAKLLNEAYAKNGIKGLESIYNHATGNLYQRYLERAKTYSTSADEVTEGKASRELSINDNKGDQYGDENQDTGILEGQVLSAIGRSENNQRKQGNDSPSVYPGLARNGDSRESTSESNSLGRNVSGYLARQDIVSPSSFNRYKESVLRGLAGKLADRDSSGRRVPQEIKEKFKDTVLKNENGELLSVFHWTSQIFNAFAYGDIGFHFGTLKAAMDRRTGKSNEIGADLLKEVYLNITNPIFLEDFGFWDCSAIAPRLWEKGLISQAELTRLQRTRGYMNGKYNDPASVAMRKILDAHGYDGIIYQNAIEGEGLSIAALYPDQIYTVSEETVGSNEGKASRELDLDYDESIEASETLTNRELLAGALESAAQNDIERNKLQQYKEKNLFVEVFAKLFSKSDHLSVKKLF